MFCVLVVAARPKMRMSTDTMSSITVTIIDFLFLLLKEPTRQQISENYSYHHQSDVRLANEPVTTVQAISIWTDTFFFCSSGSELLHIQIKMK